MKLSEFMSAAGLDDEQMAALLGGCTAHAVKKWRYGERLPRPEQLRRIAEVTGGQVTPNDFVLEAPEPAEES